MFAGKVGVPRLLKPFKEYDIKTTWFIPGRTISSLGTTNVANNSVGHSLETFPEEMAAVRDAGHEM